MIHKLARRITEKPRFILFIAVLLLIPALLGYIGTRTNYDVLSYLPEDVRSVQGEQLLEDPFQAAATSMVVVEGIPPIRMSFCRAFKRCRMSAMPSGYPIRWVSRSRPTCFRPSSATASMRAMRPS